MLKIEWLLNLNIQLFLNGQIEPIKVLIDKFLINFYHKIKLI